MVILDSVLTSQRERVAVAAETCRAIRFTKHLACVISLASPNSPERKLRTAHDCIPKAEETQLGSGVPDPTFSLIPKCFLGEYETEKKYPG